MLETAWSHQMRKQKIKYDFVVYYNEEQEHYVPVYDPNRIPEFLEALQKNAGLLTAEKKKIYAALLEQGEAYNPEKHKGHLRCPDGCNAHMKYTESSIQKSSRFKLDKNGEQSKHKKTCRYKPPKKDLRIDIDSSVSRSAVETEFNRRAPNHIANRISHPSTRHGYEDLIGRKIKQARTAADFVKIFQKANLKKDIFVDQHHIIKGEEFFVQDVKAIRNLYTKIEASPHETYFRAVIFHVSASGEKMKLTEKMSVVSHREFYFHQSMETQFDGPRHFITPRALPAREGSDKARSCFPSAGYYLVTGDVSRGEEIYEDDVVIHYMDIKIRSTDQVVKLDIDSLPSMRGVNRPQAGQGSLNLSYR